MSSWGSHFCQECSVPYSIKNLGKVYCYCYDIRVGSEKMSYHVNDFDDGCCGWKIVSSSNITTATLQSACPLTKDLIASYAWRTSLQWPRLTASWCITWTLMCHCVCSRGRVTMNLSFHGVWHWHRYISMVAMGLELVIVILRQKAKLKNISIFQNEIQFSLKTVFNIPTSATFSEFILSANSKLYRVYIGKHWAWVEKFKVTEKIYTQFSLKSGALSPRFRIGAIDPLSFSATMPMMLINLFS